MLAEDDRGIVKRATHKSFYLIFRVRLRARSSGDL
jgi:hypothetical protein